MGEINHDKSSAVADRKTGAGLMAEKGPLEFTDRYKALGIPYPDPETMCKGQCEGVGMYPQFLAGPWLKPNAVQLIQEDSVTEEEAKRWHEAHLAADHAHEKDEEDCYTGVAQCDGWHFIKCPDCNGTGLRPEVVTANA